MNRVPRFAVIGHPNEGKSSVVSNLTEDDRILITPVSGETRRIQTYPVKAGGRTVLEFIDTPGFQHPRKILKWFEGYLEKNGSAEGILQAFISANEADAKVRHDVDLLRPLKDGAAAIFVVDASHPIRKHDIAEMEILRLAGCPRMAVLNNKEQPDYREEWKAELNRHYNIIREFNAMQASFPERLRLLEALKAMHQEWEHPLADAINALREDWRQRVEKSAGAICAMLNKVAGHHESKRIGEYQGDTDKLKEQLIERYKKKLAGYEHSCHNTIRKLFRHDIFQGQLDSQTVFGKDDLFSKETWKVLGLTKRQLALTGAGALAAVGAGIDVALPGLTFGVFTAAGALLGGLSGYFGADKLGKVKLGGSLGRRLGGASLRVGPVKPGSQVFFILIDRALLYFDIISQWSHARREDNEPLITSAAECDWVTTKWSSDERKAVTAFTKSKTGREDFRRLQNILVDRMLLVNAE